MLDRIFLQLAQRERSASIRCSRFDNVQRVTVTFRHKLFCCGCRRGCRCGVPFPSVSSAWHKQDILRVRPNTHRHRHTDTSDEPPCPRRPLQPAMWWKDRTPNIPVCICRVSGQRLQAGATPWYHSDRESSVQTGSPSTPFGGALFVFCDIAVECDKLSGRIGVSNPCVTDHGDVTGEIHDSDHHETNFTRRLC